MEGGRPVAPSDTGSTQQRGRDELQVKLEAARTAAAQRAVAKNRVAFKLDIDDANTIAFINVESNRE